MYVSLKHSRNKQYDLEIRALKHRFLLFAENMLKNIDLARGECITTEQIRASHSANYIVGDLVDFFVRICSFLSPWYNKGSTSSWWLMPLSENKLKKTNVYICD